MTTTPRSILDCVIIGAGPGGYTAAIYLKRFRRNIILLDNGHSRTSLIPKTHNYPGFIQGISGNDLLYNLRKQLETYKLSVTLETAQKIHKASLGFIVECEKSQMFTKKVILATGVLDIEPDLPNLKNSIQQGLIRHCPICDGYEVIDQEIGVIGYDNKSIKQAIFLQTYSKKLTFITLGKKLTYAHEKKLKSAKIPIISEPIFKVVIKRKKIVALMSSVGSIYTFDTLYSALGAKINSDLAIELGAKCTNEGSLIVNGHNETSVPGLFAIGDIVKGLNQICVATAHAAIAASQIHNTL